MTIDLRVLQHTWLVALWLVWVVQLQGDRVVRSGLTEGVVRHNKRYVVQTEDLGAPKYLVVTQIISDGQVVKKKIVHYEQYRGSEDIDRLVDLLIRRLHQKTITEFVDQLDSAREEEDERELLRWLAIESKELENRTYPRMELITFATYVHRDANGKVDDTNLVYTLDVSEQGIRLQTKRAFQAGDLLEIHLKIKDRILQTQAEIVHCHPQKQGRFYVGAKFVELSPSDQKFLAEMAYSEN